MLRDIIYKIYDKYSSLKGRKSVYSILNEIQSLNKVSDKNVINDVVLKKVNNMLNHATEHVAYYKNLKLYAAKISSLDEITKYPVLTKDIIRRNFPEKTMATELMNRAQYNTTSGSTGEPLEFYNDAEAAPYRSASFMFFNTWMGVDERAVHWNLKSLGKYTTRQKIIYWLNGKHLYSVMDVKKENLPEIVTEIEKIQPKYLEGYTASLVRLAKLIDESDARLKHSPRAILATSENLTEFHRGLLEKAFSSEVFNRYGSREFCGAVAQECNIHKGLHVNPLLTYLEIVDDEGDPVSEGEKGRLLVTDLNNYVMPFIRYDIGDIGVKGPDDCECGSSFQVIESIEGRKGEFIVDKDGNNIPFVTISAYLFRRHYTKYVYTYQFIQDRKGEILLKIVPTEKFNEEIKNEISTTLNQILPEFKTELVVVDEIPAEKTGKTPFLKTNIN